MRLGFVFWCVGAVVFLFQRCNAVIDGMVVIHEIGVCVRIEIGNICFFFPRGVCRWKNGMRLFDEGPVAGARALPVLQTYT